MLSIVTSLHNAWFDFEQMIRHLHAHNDAADFEVCVFHDDREADGSAEKLSTFKTEFQNVKSVSVDKAATISWVRGVLADREGTWNSEVLGRLSLNLDAYEAGELLDSTKACLNLDATARLGAAIDLAEAGAPLLFLPQGSILGCKTTELETFVSAHTQPGGHFYSRLNRVTLHVTNKGASKISKAEEAQPAEDATVLSSHASLLDDDDILMRDYLHWSPDLNNYHFADPDRGEPFALGSPNFHDRVKSICEALVVSGKMPFEWASTQYHLMARATYDVLGISSGVYEIPGADLKLCAAAQQYFVQELPAHLSVLDVGGHRVSASLADARKLALAVDTNAVEHPLPGGMKFVQLTKDRSDDASYSSQAMKQDLGLL